MARGRSWLPTKHNENVLKAESIRLPKVCSSRLSNEGKQIWGRLKIVQGLSSLNRTLCRFSICLSFTVSSEKEGLALWSSSQHSFIILYLSQRKNYAWYVEQQLCPSIPIYMVHFRVILMVWCKAKLSAKPFVVAAIDLWNVLPDSIRSCD